MAHFVGRTFLAALVIAAAGSLSAAPAFAQPAAAAVPQVPLMEPATLHALIATGIRVTIVDVRQPEEFGQGHIQGAIPMPLGNLSNTYGSLRKTGKLVVYCRSGQRSAQAVEFLLRHGYSNAVSLHGGYTAWTAARY
jgi:rhodanese-related sulfurtransferase